MSEEKFHNDPKTRYESLCDLNLLGLWSQCGSDWNLTMKEEIQEAINQPIEEKKSKTTSKVAWCCILTTLALLGAATWTETPKIYQTVRKVGINLDSVLQ